MSFRILPWRLAVFESMAMLAEPRRREKPSEDPRNEAWSRDTAKYGYRMLQKMGWMDGKGLGLKEEGDTNFVRIKKKRDNSGVGVKARGDDWIGHQDAFEDLLAQLNAENQSAEASPSFEVKQLVKTAQKSKKLVYKKFLQCKDLSCKTEEDMKCIFGRKKHHQKQSEEPSDAGTASTDLLNDKVEQPHSSHGIVTITRRQSVQDYFSAKRIEIANRKKELEENTNLSLDIDASCTGAEPEDAERSKRKKRRKTETN